MQKIMITGGTGFIGKAVVEQLKAKGYSPYILTRTPHPENPNEVFCNILCAESLEKVFSLHQPDILIHLAWNVEPSSYLSSNYNLDYLSMSLQLVKLFHKNGGKKVLVAGTCFEYAPSNAPLSEESPISPNSFYAVCKNSLHNVLKEYCTLNKLELSWLRFFYLFGEEENSQRVVPYIIHNLFEDIPILCKSSEAVRDYIYVKDAAKAVVSIMESQVIGSWNIASGHPVKMKSIFHYLSSYCGKSDLVSYQNESTFSSNISADISKLNSIGFSPSYTFEDSLKLTLDWWRKNTNFKGMY